MGVDPGDRSIDQQTQQRVATADLHHLAVQVRQSLRLSFFGKRLIQRVRQRGAVTGRCSGVLHRILPDGGRDRMRAGGFLVEIDQFHTLSLPPPVRN